MADLIQSGVHAYTPDGYVADPNPLIRERLEWFKDQKLALMMHWGPYVQLGLCESCASDATGLVGPSGSLD